MIIIIIDIDIITVVLNCEEVCSMQPEHLSG